MSIKHIKFDPKTGHYRCGGGFVCLLFERDEGMGLLYWLGQQEAGTLALVEGPTGTTDFGVYLYGCPKGDRWPLQISGTRLKKLLTGHTLIPEEYRQYIAAEYNRPR